MKCIYLIRHGESQAQSGESADEVNPVLSKKGEKQSEDLRDQLAGTQFGRVFLSPLLRAWMTYKICNVNSRGTTVTSLLIEDNFGREDYYRDLIESPDPAIFPGDADEAWYQDGRARAKRFLQKVSAERSNTIAVFGHWAIFSQILQVFLGFEADIYRRRCVMANCAISKLVVEPDGARVLEFWNSPVYYP